MSIRSWCSPLSPFSTTLLIGSRHDFAVREMIDKPLRVLGLYPIPNMVKKGAASVATYAAWKIVLLPIFCFLSAHSNQLSAINVPTLFGWFGCVYIAMSFGL
jgi:hypothetical protein